jgi:hypothetical protein
MKLTTTIIWAAIVALCLSAFGTQAVSAHGHGHGHGHDGKQKGSLNPNNQGDDQGHPRHSGVAHLCPQFGGTVTIRGPHRTFQKYFQNHGECVSYFAHHPQQTIVSSEPPQPAPKPTATPKPTPVVTSLLHSTGVQGSANTLSGNGFRPGETVQVHFGGPAGAVVGNAVANTAGAVSVTFATPVRPGGSYAVCARGAVTGKTGCSTFTILSTLTVRPTSGARGSTATLTATGFAAGETATVYWGCASVRCTGGAIGTVTTTGTGDFSATFTIPSTATVGFSYAIGVKGAISHRFAATHFMVTG